jgi:hypothetical protein
LYQISKSKQNHALQGQVNSTPSTAWGITNTQKFKVMGTIKKGILGGFSGKVGTVVGASWKGISYMRSLPQKVRNPRTEGQRRQRQKFTMVVELLKPLIPILRIGWKLFAKKQSAFNAVTSYLLANAITGDFPNYQIDLSKLLISRGNLTPVADATVSPSPGSITVSWSDNSNVGNAQPTDKLLLAIVNPQKNESITVYDQTTRQAVSQTIQTPTMWSGDTVNAYIGFISEDGKEIANSVLIPDVYVS